MITPEIIAYIKVERAKGTPDALIHSNLLDNGWHEQDITEAISALAVNPSADVVTISKSKIPSLEVQQYRRKVKWITFFILAAVDLFYLYYMGMFNRAVFYQGATTYIILSYSFISLCIAYAIAAIATRSSSPQKNAAQEVVTIFAKIVGSIILGIAILVGIIFAICMFTGFGNL